MTESATLVNEFNDHIKIQEAFDKIKNIDQEGTKKLRSIKLVEAFWDSVLGKVLLIILPMIIVALFSWSLVKINQNSSDIILTNAKIDVSIASLNTKIENVGKNIDSINNYIHDNDATFISSYHELLETQKNVLEKLGELTGKIDVMQQLRK